MPARVNDGVWWALCEGESNHQPEEKETSEWTPFSALGHGNRVEVWLREKACFATDTATAVSMFGASLSVTVPSEHVELCVVCCCRLFHLVLKKERDGAERCRRSR